MSIKAGVMKEQTTIEFLKVAFRQERGASGWIDLYVAANNKKLRIQASNVFPPFVNLIHFLENILANRLPSIFVWDEEGRLKRFNAQPSENSNLFRFLIDSPSHFQGFPIEIYMEGVFEKKEFVAEFYKQFMSFLSTTYDKKKWICGNEELDLRKINLKDLSNLLHEK